jgi:hypothetical protein
MESVESQIEKKIRRKPDGTIVFSEDFVDFATLDAVHKALQRLEAKKEIARVAPGIYVKPKMNAYIGPVLPSAEQVAEAIARRDKVRTVPTGAYALNALGLSTQVPMKIVLLTDGSPREIQIGKRTIKFKKTTPKTLLAKGKISRLVIQALKALGDGKVSAEMQQKMIALLQKENKADLQHDILLAPAWIRHILKQAL